jgi:hypothetical protein
MLAQDENGADAIAAVLDGSLDTDSPGGRRSQPELDPARSVDAISREFPTLGKTLASWGYETLLSLLSSPAAV